MSEWLAINWEWVLLGFMVLEKVVKLSPSKKDDILFDSIIKPIFNMFKGNKYCLLVRVHTAQKRVVLKRKAKER